ncbi:HPr(Ser) kinase/phosphatase [Thiohalophilus thiocyanatoxydans]|uniref:HPr kinase/phosphorylase n=1 Tax=Thiohalophilus thiocyanatoxydans TaxID=381308 RepID=A0A4R8ILS5_9GAMM|nr:HPr(Ser) kinase/phosphatase [Thiohalophilus thiocyanatoxydans]TDY01084.1 Hpr(Ser) kinase/phosphatase [Thiohalophilus thiocyanatoxydans]
MSDPISSSNIFQTHQKELGLKWVAGEQNRGELTEVDARLSDSSLIGHLNLVRPNYIQVLADTELEYLNNLGKNSLQDTLQRLFDSKPLMVIIADSITPPESLLEFSRQTGTPLITSSESSHKIVDHLHYYLSNQLTEKTVFHGVFMEVFGIGVLLTGPSGVGKSELALELLSRGHRLVADDAPEFRRTAPDAITGNCPSVLTDFIEVRGLGVLNIRAMYGNNAILDHKRLRLIVRLDTEPDSMDEPIERLDHTGRSRRLLEVDIPEVRLPVAPGRDLAVIIEAAVRNHVLYLNGYNAAQDFIERQQDLINQARSS